MSKNALLVTVAATALIAGASLASAQTMNTEQPKASAPVKSNSEKSGPSAQSPKKDAEKAQTTGQAPKAEDAKQTQDHWTGSGRQEGARLQARPQDRHSRQQTPRVRTGCARRTTQGSAWRAGRLRLARSTASPAHSRVRPVRRVAAPRRRSAPSSGRRSVRRSCKWAMPRASPASPSRSRWAPWCRGPCNTFRSRRGSWRSIPHGAATISLSLATRSSSWSRAVCGSSR